MDEDFAEKLIKGKIAEIIFAQMFREEEKYSVIPFGYENTMPGLINRGVSSIARQVRKNISTAPDFVLILDNKDIFLVEVKYRKELNKEKIQDIAGKQKMRWNPSWIFLSTPDGFYFDSCTNIIEHQGDMKKLGFIGKDSQEKYLKLLNRFEK